MIITIANSKVRIWKSAVENWNARFVCLHQFFRSDETNRMNAKAVNFCQVLLVGWLGGLPTHPTAA